MTKYSTLPTPRFPDDFVVEHADGGATFWWWSPDGEPPRADANEEFPSGLMIAGAETVSHEWAHDERVCVTWEWGPETESGPCEDCTPDPNDVRRSVERVMNMLREDAKCAETND